MDVIAQVSNVAHGHFVFLHHGFFHSGDVLISWRFCDFHIEMHFPPQLPFEFEMIALG